MSADRSLVPVPAQRRMLPMPATRAGRGRKSVSLPLRAIFLSTMLSTLVGSSIIGGALAWPGSEFTPDQVIPTAEMEAVVRYTPNGSLVGPNDGTWVAVGTGSVENTGQLSLGYVDSRLELTGVSNASPACTLDMFAGQLIPFAPLRQQIIPGMLIPIAFRVDLAALPSALPECNGAVVSFTTTFTFSLLSP